MKKIILTSILSVVAMSAAHAQTNQSSQVQGYPRYVEGYSAPVIKVGDGTCLRTDYYTSSVYLPECDPRVPPNPPVVVQNIQRNAVKIYFEFDSARLTYESQRQLELFLKEQGDGVYDIEAGTDFIGTQRYNDRLSAARADSIVHYLERKSGVRIGSVTALGESEARRQFTPECQEVKNNRRQLIACIAEDRFGAVSIIRR